MLSVTWNPGRHIELSILSLQRHSDSCERAASKNRDLDLRLDAEMQRAVRLCLLQMAVAWRGMASSRLDSPAHRVTRCSPRARCSSSPPAPIPACLESTRLALLRLASHGLQCIRPLTASAHHSALPHSPSSPSAKTCSFGPCSLSSPSPTAPSCHCALSLSPSLCVLNDSAVWLPFHPSHLRNHHHLVVAAVEFRSLRLDIPVGTSLPFNRRSPPPRTTLSCPPPHQARQHLIYPTLGLSRSAFSFKPAPPLASPAAKSPSSLASSHPTSSYSAPLCSCCCCCCCYCRRCRHC